MRRPLVLAALALPLLAGCEWLGIESPEKIAAAREAEGRAIGGACRHAGRAIEDCFALNRRADKAAVFAGWRDMNDYMRENKIDEVPPQLAAEKPARVPDEAKPKGKDSLIPREAGRARHGDNPRMSRLLRLWRDPQFRRGAAGMWPFVPGIAAWGVVTGVAMVKGGLGVPLALLMSLVVYAGSAQLAAIPLLAAGAPVWVILAAAFCVNLRFVIYSAQWRVHFEHLPVRQRLGLAFFAADLNLIAFQRDWPQRAPAPGQVPYFIGGVAIIWLAWQLASVLGIVLADHIPPEWGLGFAGTLAMLGLTYGLVRDRSTWVAAAVAGTAAVAAFALPLKLNILVAIAAAVAAGLVAEQAARSWAQPEALR